IPTVRGNEDRIVVEPPKQYAHSTTLNFTRESLNPKQLEWLKGLKTTSVVYESCFMCHGSPERDDEYLLMDVSEGRVELKKSGQLAAALSSYQQRIFLCGHDHVPRIIYLPGGKLIIDPGSVGLPAYSDDLPFPHVMESGTPHARYSILYEKRNNWQVENIAVPYDWRTAANEAKKNDRPDWAECLETGR
ncbi:MAG: metallophosphoesterase family protein, partial [bacterium]|nr:metallophosphoesterase family protein [bacterium]